MRIFSSTFLEGLLDSEHGSVPLHGGLHLSSDLSGGDVSFGVSVLVELLKGLESSIYEKNQNISQKMKKMKIFF